jgi:hypothetical protein
VRLAATAFVVSRVVMAVMAPKERDVVTKKMTRLVERPSLGRAAQARLDMQGERRVRPIGMKAPPMIAPRTVRSQVVVMEAALRMPQRAGAV